MKERGCREGREGRSVRLDKRINVADFLMLILHEGWQWQSVEHAVTHPSTNRAQWRIKYFDQSQCANYSTDTTLVKNG